MPYEPLHHKYRPQTFAELVGQESVATTLTNALRQQRIAPAYLFTGARGTGKTSSARILAKSLNCLESNAPTEKPCGKCEVCRMIASGSALDVIEIDAASNTGVDNIRELIERAQFAPVQCRYKVYVVDECHMLSTAAFNALLKTLEEPPDRVVFVLATTDPQRVLPTIISRCQRFDFRRIPLEAMVQHMGKIADKEAIDVTPEAIQLVAQISQGGLRDAQSLLDQLSLLEGQITAERVWDLVGAVPERDLLALVQAIAADDATAVVDRTRRLMDRGREPLIVLQNLASFYRDLLIAKTSPDRQDLIAVTSSTWAEMCAFTQTLDLHTILQGQQHLRQSEAQVKNTTQPRLWLEVTLMGLLPSALAGEGRGQEVGRGQKAEGRRQAGHSIGMSGQERQVQVSPPSSPLLQQVESPSPAIKHSEAAVDPVLIQAEVQQAAEVEQQQRAAESEPIEAPIEAETPEIQPVEPVEPVQLSSSQPSSSHSSGLHSSGLQSSSSVDLEEVWETVIAQIKFRGTQVLLQQQALLLAFDGQEARIGIKSQPLFQMARKQITNIEVAFEAVYRQRVRVSLEVTTAAESTSRSNSTIANGSASPSHSPRKPTARESAPPPAKPTRASSYLSPPSEVNSPDAGAPATLEPTGSPAWQEEDEVKGAARSVAQFFNGEIVSLEEPSIVPSSNEATLASAATDLDEVDGEPDEDVPF